MTATPEIQPLDPSALEAKCPRCATELWAERAGVWTLKARILRFQGHFVAVCPTDGCRGEVPIPWLMVNPDAGSHRAAPRRRFIVRTLDTQNGGSRG